METILIVDDNPTNLEVLFRTLDKPEYRILVARDGESALQIVAQEQPTLTLLDIMMPGMDGFEVCRRIKADAAMQKTAVIFLSALGDTEAKVKGFQLGGLDYIAKPFQAEEVVARVATHVRNQQLERQLENRNRELESELEQILGSMAEGVYGLDQTGQISYLNASALELTGFSETELLGSNVFEQHFQLADDAQWLDSQPMQRLRAGELVHAEPLSMACKDGSHFYAHVCLTPNVRGDEFLGGVLVFRDVTARLEAESALAQARDELQSQRQQMAHVERLSTMGEMAAGFAHEVNQPLTAIANYASVSIRLLNNPTIERDRMEDTLRKLQTQAIRASEVIQRLRGFVRTPKDNKVLVDMNKLMAAVVDLAEVDSRKLGVGITLVAAATAATVYVDEVQLQQVALNLIRNAMEATVENKRRDDVCVTISCVPQHVCVEVCDQGVGLQAEAATRLFTPFYSTKAKGMGVGLSVCSSIIKDHQGEIGYTTQTIGTCFWFKLPRHV